MGLRVALLAAAFTAAAGKYSTPTGELPDVALSSSYFAVSEGGAAITYTVKLTHAPGMKEDGTIDTASDEVYVYLYSSQDVFQETAPGTFASARSHRSQLQISTSKGTSWVDSPGCAAADKASEAACFPETAAGKRLPWGCGDSVPSSTAASSPAAMFVGGVEWATKAAYAAGKRDWTCPYGMKPTGGYGDAALASAANVHSKDNAQSGDKDCGKGCDPTSSPALLIFDSTSWRTAQTVTVTARDDDVFEAEVNRRGQDAYVHHYVVAQDVATNHAYYHNIKVNDVTVSITDNDPAVVLENDGTTDDDVFNNPLAVEGGASAVLKLKLASEPMHSVRVDLQSGKYFSSCNADNTVCVPVDSLTLLDQKDVTYSWNGADDNHVVFSKIEKAQTVAAHNYFTDSQVSFSTQNWDTYQTVTVLARDDHLDEGVSRNHDVGFIISSLDYYYNSAGAGKVPGFTGAAGKEQPPSCTGCAKADQRVCTAADAKQVELFSPPLYDARLGKTSKGTSKCGAVVTVKDNNYRYVNISRVSCEATEGKVSLYDKDHASATTCDYTIRLNTAPVAGATVVVQLREDAELSAVQDAELWFTEHRASAPGYDAALSAQPNEGFSIDVPFTDESKDCKAPAKCTGLAWDAERTIKVVAYDDSVDEPTETRTVYHTVAGTDATYKGIDVASTVVTVVDNDIADLVLICKDSANLASYPIAGGLQSGAADHSSGFGVGSAESGTRTGPIVNTNKDGANTYKFYNSSAGSGAALAFKGTGPAQTEGAGNFACSIYTRECLLHNGTSTDSEGKPCRQGQYQVQLGASPGVRKVRRNYVGESASTVESEYVQVVITPDPTPQTTFAPASVTFTHVATPLGCSAAACKTFAWDAPQTFTVVPVDDDVDERREEIVDFTAHTVTQSHGVPDDASHAYWKYTTPYQVQTKPVLGGYVHGKTCGVPSTAAACGGTVNTAHTKYRHTIRTVHRHDNDFAGLTLESKGASSSRVGSNPSLRTHPAVSLKTEEGGSFTWYTMQLDTQPRKPQRQNGTDPNVDVEPEETYWVDITARYHLALNMPVPVSCPVSATWGGGSAPEAELNYVTSGADKVVVNRFNYPLDDPNTAATYEKQTTFVPTCGGWQFDSTYRFESGDWSTPQYVYISARNDGAVSDDDISAQIVHTVETEDSENNMKRGGCAMPPCGGFVSGAKTYRYDKRSSCVSARKLCSLCGAGKDKPCPPDCCAAGSKDPVCVLPTPCAKHHYGGMKAPPPSVTVTVSDNDAIKTAPVIKGCRNTQLMQFPTDYQDATASSAEWLVDYNCPSDDAGGLPGYPTRFAAETANTRPGYAGIGLLAAERNARNSTA